MHEVPLGNSVFYSKRSHRKVTRPCADDSDAFFGLRNVPCRKKLNKTASLNVRIAGT